jgi:aryl-alcohol dehydrogenase-like predicted oxidoreductase
MEQLKLGKSELMVSRIGYGCWGLSGAYGKISSIEAEDLICRVLDLGINFLDTADIYGAGENEKMVGRAIKNRRQEVVLATKFGYVGDEHGGLRIDGSPEQVKRACEASLSRLGTDYIDVYYLHRVDKTIPITETVGAMEDLRREGKIRAIGLSEAGIHTIEAARSIANIEVLQSEFSLATPDLSEQMIPYLEANNIVLAAFSPLSRGMLTEMASYLEMGQEDYRRLIPRFDEGNYRYNLSIVRELESIAHDLDCPLASLALAWVLASGKNIIPIPGTRKLAHLEENIRALDLSLTDELVQKLSGLAGSFYGERHNPVNAAFYDKE